MNKIWTESEKTFIRENAAIMTDSVVAKQLEGITGRKVSVQAVRKQRSLMQIRKKPGRGICQVLPFSNLDLGGNNE